MEKNRKRYIIATWRIQRSFETLCLYSDDEKVEEYLKKLEESAEYYAAEERKLMEK